MKQIVTALALISSFIFLTSVVSAQDRFDRTATIPARDVDNGGFGNVVAGVDFDGDGKVEIYSVNNDWQDVVGGDLVPRIYKYEKNSAGQWGIVWWTRLDFSFQNTWPAMAPADLDQDGKYEIVWGPVNNFGGGTNPNPSRIVVFETSGDGSDDMGIDNGDGTYSPNAQWTIVEEDNVELRPFRWFINDIDADGVDEIVTILRSGSPVVQVYSTDDVPDNGDGSETWVREFAGGGEATHWDLTIVDSTIYAIAQSGDVTPITYSASGDSFRVGATQVGLVPNGSWKSAATVDVDDNGTDEILVASWLDNAEGKRVWLLQQDADTLSRTQIADFSAFPDIRRLNGADVGDVDADGNIDYIIGTRDFDTPPGDVNAIARVEYLGGDITNPANYEATVIDQNVIAPQGSQADVVFVANLDDDQEDEVIFAGETRPFGSGPPVLPISVLELIPGNQPKITDVVDVPNDNGRQVWVTWQGAADDVGGLRLKAELSGDNEVPPVTTNGFGRATFTLNENQTELSYLLEVFNIDSVTQAHIHQGDATENGPVGVFLFGFVEGGGPVNGVLASGTITEDDLIGPWEGDLDGFLNDLLTGNTYVNVHTTTHPPGEIRGQIKTESLTKAQAQRSESAGFSITHYVVWRLDNGVPVQVSEPITAIQAPRYAAVVPTLADGDTTESTFVVSAHTAKPHVLWKSAPKSGFSLDNLAPSAPTNVVASETAEGALLTWEEVPEEDFQFFTVVRGTESGFDPEAGEIVGFATDPTFLDSEVSVGETFFYRVRATDFNNNAGAFSAEVSLLITSVSGESGSAIPTEFALRQNYPNPFNPETNIAYDVPKSTDVTLKIYNMMGQKVKTLVDKNQPAGQYTVLWDGTDDFGTKVSSGLYVYVIKAGDFRKSRRMTLLK